ncbi:hypothetical protein [Corallococcus sp. AS-1-6]|uniref:hypothetical protein n=1 Tax=Corallococcus sp. AS-1-6 TaxID=2874599 RepID=UPI001CBFEAEA|nr:hypothetical protein [Corallococcus sp. AS-1-6]MBZ4370613.1 hypothetical protein [Corallococcus sp. AS-1-6]
MRASHPTFAVPQAVSPKVASTLHRFRHHALIDAVHGSARTYHVTVKNGRSLQPAPKGTPTTLSVVLGGRRRDRPTALYLDRLPVAAQHFQWDPHRGLLTWNFRREDGTHSGRLVFQHGGHGFVGSIETAGNRVGVEATLAPVSYDCAVALDTGATVTGTPPALQLHWNPQDPRWQAATWVQDALQFTWQVTGTVIVGQETYNIATSFNDLQTQTQWTPATSSMGTVLSSNLVFNMALNSGVSPGADNRSTLSDPSARAIPTVFPYQMAFAVTDEGSTLTGAMLTVNDSQAGTTLGLQGLVVNPSVVGLYTLNGAGSPIAVHGGRLYVQDEEVPTSRLRGSTLHFEGLTQQQQRLTGLPESGTIHFSQDGHSAWMPGQPRGGRRVQATELTAPAHRTAFAAHPVTAVASSAVVNTQLNLTTLANMTQFAFSNNVWADVVQQATMSDFNQVMMYYLPSNLRQTYFGTGQPVLPSWLQTVASMGTNPSQWYQSLATAYLTNVLSTFNEDGADQLNALRAQNWLKTQTAASPVFQVQSTAMYSHEWSNQPQNAALPQYLADQQQNRSTYNQYILADQQKWLAELRATIIDPSALTTMTNIVNTLVTTAVNNGLYWAYTFFRYISSPQELTIIEMMSLGQAADLDGSAFMRQCQTNVALLSLLDPSNVFSQQYISVIQTFQIGNMLPELFDYSANPDDYVYDVQQVMAQIAVQYGNSSDPQVQQAAQEAAKLAADTQLAEYIATMQAAAVGKVGIYGWEQIAPLMAESVTGKVGTLGANLLCMGLGAVGVMGIVYGALGWSELSPTQRTALVSNAASFAIQATSSILKRGVALEAVWDTDATLWDNIRPLFSSDLMSQADARLQSGFQKWLVNDGSIEEYPSEMFGTLFSETAEEDSSLVTKVFGKNLDEFVATRLGAAFAIINLVTGILIALHAQSSLEAAGDWLLVAASGLDLLATAGSWALGAAGIEAIGGLAVTTLCSVLSILGIMAAVAGVVILLYLALRPHLNPVQQFGQDYAKPAGFFMQYKTEIDYFNGYVQQGEPQRLGLTLSIPNGNGAVLKVGANGALGSLASNDYSYDTVFFASTNGTGQTVINALVGGASGSPTLMALTANSDNSVSFKAPLASTDSNYGTQLWSVVLKASPARDGQFFSSGSFSIQRYGTSGQWLSWNGQTAVISASGGTWTVTQVPMVPAGLTMGDIMLYTFSQGQVFNPVLTQPGSQPKTWSITPVLPSWLVLDTSTGAISEPPNAPSTLPLTPATRYTLSVSNGVGNAQAVTTSFTVQVVEFGTDSLAAPLLASA